jgi:integration host factor subunit beta
MKKSDLINVLAEKHKLTEKQAMGIVDIMFDGFANELKNGGRIEIRGFGSFAIKEYGAYRGRDPRTGTAVEVKPKERPFFRVGRELKKRVNSSG